MNTLHYLLRKILQMIVVLVLAVLVLWFVSFAYPNFKLSTLVGGDLFSSDWLPAPRNYSKAPSADTDGMNGTLYVHGEPYRHQNPNPETYQNAQYNVYVTASEVYGQGGTQVFDGSSASVERALYVRNLSIYPSAQLSTGTTFFGEAKEEMFRNGRMTILITSSSGNLLATEEAVMMPQWSIPGWSRFQVTIRTYLQKDIPCKLIFVSANRSVNVHMNVICK
jgi:hypothetical protein